MVNNFTDWLTVAGNYPAALCIALSGMIFLLIMLTFLLYMLFVWLFDRWQARKFKRDDKLYRLKQRLRFYYVSKDCKGLNPPSAALRKAAEAYGIQNSQGLYVEDIIMKIVDKELKHDPHVHNNARADHAAADLAGVDNNQE